MATLKRTKAKRPTVAKLKKPVAAKLKKLAEAKPKKPAAVKPKKQGEIRKISTLTKAELGRLRLDDLWILKARGPKLRARFCGCRNICIV